MQHKFIQLLAAVLIAVSVTACKQKQAESPTQAYQQLPDAPAVLTALDQKNYEEALTALAKVKGSAATEEQQMQFSLLNREVGEKLKSALPADPKAAEALQAWRLMTTGR